MEERWRKLWVGGGKVEVTCGGRYGGKSGGVWRKKIIITKNISSREREKEKERK